MKREIDADKMYSWCVLIERRLGISTDVLREAFTTPPAPASEPEPEIPEAVYEAAFDAAAGCTIEYRYGRRQERYGWQEGIDAAIRAYRKARPGWRISRRAIEVCMNPAEQSDMRRVIVAQICRRLEAAGVIVTD